MGNRLAGAFIVVGNCSLFKYLFGAGLQGDRDFKAWRWWVVAVAVLVVVVCVCLFVWVGFLGTGEQPQILILKNTTLFEIRSLTGMGLAKLN